MYGTLYGSGLSVLMIGVPSYDPTVFLLPPTNFGWTHGAWNFFPTPTVLASGPGLWNTLSSPCMTCSIAKMFTVSPVNTTNDTSCFGLCSLNQVPDGRWDQIVMGELTNPCTQTPGSTATCTIMYTTNGSWYGGLNSGGGARTDGNTVWSKDDINRGLEGIEFGRTAVNYGTGYDVPAGTFKSLIQVPTPPPARCPIGCPCISARPQDPAPGSSFASPYIACPSVGRRS
jgi:hypothetical protein